MAGMDVVTVKLHCGKGFVGAKTMFEPMCSVLTSFAPKKKKKTVYASKSNAPEWNSTIYLPLDLSNKKCYIHIECWEKKFFSPEYLGECTITMKSILKEIINSASESVTKWFPLQIKSDKKSDLTSGQINVSVILPQGAAIEFANSFYPIFLNVSNKPSEQQRLSDQVDTKTLAPSERHRLEVILEFFNTEERYVHEVKILLSGFRKPLVDQKIISREDASAIFLNMEEILLINEPFLYRLRKRQKNRTVLDDISDLILDIASEMYVYIDYCSEQNQSIRAIERLTKENPAFETFLQSDLPAWRGISLAEYLVKPFQRITRYPMLLREIIKVTPQESPQYKNLEKAHKLLTEIMTKANDIVLQNQDKQLNESAWAIIEQSPTAKVYLTGNFQVISDLSHIPGVNHSSCTMPKVIYQTAINYRKDDGVPRIGHCILFENCIFLAHGKLHIQEMDIIPLLSLRMEDYRFKDLLEDTKRRKSKKSSKTDKTKQQLEAEQDDKELSYLTSKFIRFERLFYDEIVRANQFFLNFPHFDVDTSSIKSALSRLESHFLISIEKAATLLHAVPEEIQWKEIYIIFMALMPFFQSLADCVIANVPILYTRSLIACSNTAEQELVQLFQGLFAIVDHTPAYVRSADRIIQRIPDDPTLPELYATCKMIKSSVSKLESLRRQFDAQLELQSIEVCISETGGSIYDESRFVVHKGRLFENNTGKRFRAILFNDLFVTFSSSDRNQKIVHKIPLDASVVGLQLSPTVFQLCHAESGTSLLVLRAKRESTSQAWLGHIQSVLGEMADSKGQQKPRKPPASRKLDINITGSRFELWSLSFSSSTTRKVFMAKVIETRLIYLRKVYSSCIRDLFNSNDSFPVISIPNLADKELATEYQTCAQAEYLLTQVSLEDLDREENNLLSYNDLCENLQGSILRGGGDTNQEGDKNAKKGATVSSSIKRAITARF